LLSGAAKSPLWRIEAVSRGKRQEGGGGKGKVSSARTGLDEQIARLVKDKARAASGGREMSDNAVSEILTQIDGQIRLLDGPVVVSYLGPEASFTHAAAVSWFGPGAGYIPAIDIGDIFGEVEKGNATYGVAPIENSTDGTVNTTLDALVRTSLQINAELSTPIAQNLLSEAESLAQLETIYAMPIALGQCRMWLRKNLPAIEVMQVATTTQATKMCIGQPTAAAIGSAFAAEYYNIPILVPNIHDNPKNTTRFFVVSHQKAAPTGHDKTSIAFSVAHKAGSLCEALDVFRAHGINMSMVVSRPLQNAPWEYVFFADLEGHAGDDGVAAALAELKEKALFLNVLGSYPRYRG
jgi:chorismate mutase/prephenate dehydratase